MQNSHSGREFGYQWLLLAAGLAVGLGVTFLFWWKAEPGNSMRDMTAGIILTPIFVVIAASFILRVKVDPSGIEIQYLLGLGRNQTIPWSTILSINHKDVSSVESRGKDLHLLLKSGKTVKFSEWGVKEFEPLCKVLQETFERYKSASA